jgi:uncharacterized protein (TIGR02466 family)
MIGRILGLILGPVRTQSHIVATAVPIERLFPTQVYRARLAGRDANALQQRLLRECRQLRDDDAAGRLWSRLNYPGGYTSYGSAHRMHTVSPSFALLRRRLGPHVARLARALALDLRGRALQMTDCWVNIMAPGVVHGLHLHPLSTISGTYYVRTPAGAAGLKLEDPRLERMMAAPPRRRTARRALQPWVVVPACGGEVVLFESWLRHEVAASHARSERISISFNYSWF